MIEFTRRRAGVAVPADDQRMPQRGEITALRLVFGSKWAPEILHVLADGPRRRMDIWSAIQPIGIACSDGVLAARRNADPLDRALDRLVGGGLVERSEERGVFPRRVVYAVTADAVELVALLMPICAAAEKFGAARRQRRRRPRNRTA